MANLDDQYRSKAQEIENKINIFCQLRQEDKSIALEVFHKNHLDHGQQKAWSDLLSLIGEYLFTLPQWKHRIDGKAFIDVFDECLKKYKPQGKFFLNFFINRYSLRMSGTKNDKDIDEEKSIFKKAESIDVNVKNDEKSTTKLSGIDRKSVNEYEASKVATDIEDIVAMYKEADNLLGNDYLPYLRYFFTFAALSEDLYINEDIKYLFVDVYDEQMKLRQKYLQEYKAEKENSNINIQEKAFLRAKYCAAIADKIGLKPDTIRRHKKLKATQKVLADIADKLHWLKK